MSPANEMSLACWLPVRSTPHTMGNHALFMSKAFKNNWVTAFNLLCMVEMNTEIQQEVMEALCQTWKT